MHAHRLFTVWSCLVVAGLAASDQKPLQPYYAEHAPPKQIAIIGAGAAGTSAAYYARQYCDQLRLPINITIYDSNNYIGGRSTTVIAYDDVRYPVELGASIFVEANKILVDAVNKFNLKTSKYGKAASKDSSAPSLGIWNGREFIVTLSNEGPSWWDTAKILIRYGLAPIRTKRLAKSVVDKFLLMYSDEHFPFDDLTAVASMLDLTTITEVTGEEYLEDNGISKAYARDVIQASSRVNYGQNLAHFHALETMVCMSTEGAMSVDGGNWRIFEHMIYASKATLQLDKRIGAVKEDPSDHSLYLVSAEGAIVQDKLEAVIIAASLEESGLSINFDHAPVPDVEYVQLHVTLWTSPHPITPSQFGLGKNQEVPLTILTTLPPDETPQPGNKSVGSPGFFSLSTLSTLTNPSTGETEYLYKLFSAEEFSPEQIGAMHGHGTEAITWMHHKLWHSYPYETPRDSFAPTKLAEDLYYTGGMESFISTMETNALMGKNVAKILAGRMMSQREMDEIIGSRMARRSRNEL